MRWFRVPMALAALITALVASLGACASSDTIEVGADTVIIDVRTPAEYAQGHLDGALNIDLQSGTFETQIDSLPNDGDYIVYCRSGNRSAQAAQIMAAAGFTNVRDAGALQDAADATGLAIVA